MHRFIVGNGFRFNTASGNAQLQLNRLNPNSITLKDAEGFNTASGNAQLQHESAKEATKDEIVKGFNTASGNAQLQQKGKKQEKTKPESFNTASGNAQLQR